MSACTEDHLVEQPAIQFMQHELGWDVMNCFGDPSSQELRRSGWEVPGKAEMLKTEMLKRKKAIDGAVGEFSRDFFFTAQSPVEANREIAKLLKGGVTGKALQMFTSIHLFMVVVNLLIS